MKAKHIITTCGIIMGGLALTQGASAVVTYQDSSKVQFTFAPVLSMTLTGDNFLISDLTPGTSDISEGVQASVTTNSVAGYILSATVGNDSTYNSTDLVSAGGKFSMIGSSDSSLSAGTWGYTLDNGSQYGALSRTTPTVLQTTNAAGTGSAVTMKIGAYAASTQAPGTYSNVINFAVVSNVIARTVQLSGSNASVVLGDSGTAGSFAEGDVVNISATCTSGTFSGWTKNAEVGTIANPSAPSTTYTVGAGNVTLTATCE